MRGQVAWIAGLAWWGVSVAAWADASAQTRRFDVWEYRVDGNTILTTRDIERVLYPHLGPQLDLGRVETARAALESVYRERGYATVAVTIPEQTVDEGIVVLTVTEQRIGRMRVSGARYNAYRDIAAAVPSLSEGTVLNTKDVQRELQALGRRSRDVRYDPRVKSGRRAGTLDVELAVEDELPIHGRVELNNFASANTTDLRLNATASYENLFQRQHALVLNSQVSPEDTSEVRVLSGTYVVRPAQSDAIYSITAVSTDSDVAAVGGTAVLGEGTFVFTRGFFPLRSRDGVQDNLVVGVDYKDSKDDTTFLVEADDGTSRTDVSKKNIGYANWMIGYNGVFEGLGGDTTLDLDANAGLRHVLNESNEFEQKRYKGEPNYLHVDVDASRLQRLPWLGIRLAGRLRGQWTGDALIANEQFNVGGAGSVRGYLESEELADYGVGTSIELLTPDFGAQLPSLVRGEAYVFWDWSNGRLNDPLPEENADFDLASFGAGVRFATHWGLDADAWWARVLEDASTTEDGDDRVSFRVGFGL